MAFRTMLMNANIGLKSWGESKELFIIIFSTTSNLTDFVYDAETETSFAIDVHPPLTRNLL